MKKRNRIVSALTALCLCLCLAAVPVAAAPEGEDLRGSTVVLVTANIRGDIALYPRIAALKESFQARGADVLLADAGNFLQGTVYAAADFGASIFELMELAGYDIAAAGPAEFAWSRPETGSEDHGDLVRYDDLFALAEGAGFPVISASVQKEGAAAFAPYVVLTTKQGRTVGFTAVTAERTGGPFPADSVFADVTFLDSTRAGAAALAAAGEMEAEVKICLSGLGQENLGQLSGSDAFDALIDTARTEAGEVSVTVVNAGGEVSTSTLNLNDGSPAPAQGAVADRVEEMEQAEQNAPSARSQVSLSGADQEARKGETALGDLWADALRWFALEGNIGASYDEDDIAMGNTGIAVDADHVVALWNGGNLRGDLPAGVVTDTELSAILPYPNRVAVVYLSGRQLTEALEAASQGLPWTQSTSATCSSFMQVSGLEYTVDLNVPYARGEAYGESWFRAASLGRVTIRSVSGKAFEPDATYAVITSNANFNGMDSSYVFKEAAEADVRSTITTAAVKDVVWRYIREELGGVIGADYGAPQGRITLTEPSGPVFEDVSAGSWYAAAVQSMAEKGIMQGTEAGRFRPEMPLTRGMSVQLLYNLAGAPAVDTQEDRWYAAARRWAMDTGVSDGTDMEGDVTREQLALMLYRAKHEPDTGGDLSSYPDGDAVSSWARQGLAWAVEQGILQGDQQGRLMPQATATRAQTAVMMERYLAL